VWSGGKLTIVPYGDAALSANGATYTPPAAPNYALGDDDFLENRATNAASAAASGSPDPVIVTRLDPAEQENDVKVEYLDRANLYNPTVVEAKNDAAIQDFGLKSAGSKQFHLFCRESAALASAQLMLGRSQVRRTFAFTLGREYILLDPMDIVAITDANAGLSGQWVRIKEITENTDRSLGIVAEEYLDGTGAAPLYGHQRGGGYVANYNAKAPDALAPLFFDAPVQIGNVLGMETIVATNGSGGNWGGCEIWISSDDVNFKYAGTLWGGTAMGTLTAALASGSDPDTTNTLSVDLSSSKGTLAGGTMADADKGNTLCLIDQELVTFESATLTGQYTYDLGTYLRRGFYGTTIAAHSSGAPFARLRQGSYFTVGYDAADIGQTIHVKLLSFNPWGGGKQTLDAVSSYPHTLATPPAVSGGLLAGLFQTPDMALQAATAQLTVSAAGPIALPLTPANATLVSGSLTTIGGLVQIAYDAQFTNTDAANPATVIWRVTYQGVVVLDSAAITIQPGATATVAKQATFASANQTGLFAFIADYLSGPTSAPNASYVDLSVTELRR
jgi:Putative phage tail protein